MGHIRHTSSCYGGHLYQVMICFYLTLACDIELGHSDLLIVWLWWTLAQHDMVIGQSRWNICQEKYFQLDLDH